MRPLHETLRFTREVSAPLGRLWDAFAEPSQRADWGTPEGEAQVYDQAQFMIGGRDRYRCGPPETLDFNGVVDYIDIVERELIVYSEIVHAGDQLLSAALLTVRFSLTDAGSRVDLTDQLTSFVGEGMVQGHQSGHAKALGQLAAYLETTPSHEER